MALKDHPKVAAPISRVEQNLGYSFQDTTLLQTALTHPSMVAESSLYNVDNQRLEFLGDAVLELALTEALYRRFPDKGEGVLTKWRARLVSRPALAEFGRTLELGPAMLIGKGEVAHGGRDRPSILSDCVEAVLGAVYLDGGFDSASQAVMKMVEKALQAVVKDPQSGNPKGELQEALQSIAEESPDYRILSMTGPDHERVFEASVLWQEKELGRGFGASKKAAETAAAADALAKSHWPKTGGGK